MLEFFSEHKRGILGTLIFHGILLLIFVLFKFSTTPPDPGQQGIMINFGNMPDASGAEELQRRVTRQAATQQQAREPQQQQIQQPETRESQPQQQETSNQQEQEVATQDMQDAPAIDQKQEESQQQEQETQPEENRQQQQEETQQQQQQQEEAQPERQVNERALYSGKSDTESGESEGQTQGEGNQGRETGSPESDNYANVDSRGMGGIDFSLQGRNPESLPKPEYNYQVEGKVVVEITVDKNGNVTKASAGVKGSTTLNDKLLSAARRAALKAKFDRKPDAPAYQKGTITYYFRLQ